MHLSQELLGPSTFGCHGALVALTSVLLPVFVYSGTTACPSQGLTAGVSPEVLESMQLLVETVMGGMGNR